MAVSRSVKIGVSPYSDGSGFEATVHLVESDDGRGPMLSIDITGSNIEVSKWPEIRAAVETALLVFAPRPAPTTGEEP